MNTDSNYDSLYQLRKHASHLDSICTPNRNAKPTYEIMSGALVWSDETTSDTPTCLIGALRQLFGYRTRLMLDATAPDMPFWNECVELFPHWIGFLPHRRQPTPELLAVYRRGEVSLKACLRQLERE